MRDYSGLGQVLYEMFNWDGSRPEMGAFGFERWEKLHAGPGQYNFGVIDAWLDKQRGKPCAFSVANALSQMDGWEGTLYDATPRWIYDDYDAGRPVMYGRRVGHIAETAAIPAYEDKSGPYWRYLREFVLAFGARYDSDPRLTAVFFAPGLDMENQPSKAPYGDGNTGYRFGQLCAEYIKWHAEAFPTKPLFWAGTTGQGRMEQAQLAASYGLGVKNNGLLPDMDSHQGYGAFVGAWDYMAWAVASGVPTWVETAHWLSVENMYWSIPACLHYHPAGVDVHSGWLEKMPGEWLEFWRRHVGVTAETSPSAWCVLRDSEYPKRTWTQNGAPAGCSGHVGNWDFYLTMDMADSDTDVVEDIGPSEAPESRQCRRVREAYFAVDPGFRAGPYEVEVRWWAEPGRALTIEWADDDDLVHSTTVYGRDEAAWVTDTATVGARSWGIASNGGAYVHMVTATPKPEAEQPPDPEPEPEPEVDWATMVGQMDRAEAALEKLDAARRELQGALATLRAKVEAILKAEGLL